ncbi:MAG: hypothetical protein ACK4N5_11965 [Myxococcales bacterium]
MRTRSMALLLACCGALAGAWAVAACGLSPGAEPGTGGGFVGGGSSGGGSDAGASDGGASGGEACAPICGRALTGGGCAPKTAGPDCAAFCREALSEGWSQGTFELDVQARVSSGCTLDRPAAPCAGRSGDALTQCLAPYLERCVSLCRCQSGCSGLFAVQSLCNTSAAGCADFETCMGSHCGHAPAPDAGVADGGAPNCVAGAITFRLGDTVRTACATTLFQGTYVIATASGSESGGVFDVVLTLENLPGVHVVPPKDAARHAQVDLNVGGRSYGSASGTGAVLVNSVANRRVVGAFAVQVALKSDPAQKSEVTGSFDVQY